MQIILAEIEEFSMTDFRLAFTIIREYINIAVKEEEKPSTMVYNV